jgi:hypothetical protein
LSKRYYSAQSQALNAAFDVGLDIVNVVARVRGLLRLRTSTDRDDLDGFVRWLTARMSSVCCRAYICAADGTQLSYNYARTDSGMWEVSKYRKGCNWAWRPYFLESIAAMNRSQQGILSKLYRDIDSLKAIRTFSCPLHDDHYLFVDLDVDQLAR